MVKLNLSLIIEKFILTHFKKLCYELKRNCIFYVEAIIKKLKNISFLLILVVRIDIIFREGFKFK